MPRRSPVRSKKRSGIRTTSSNSAKSRSSARTKARAARSPKSTSRVPPLWEHQKATLRKARKTPRLLDLSDPGTGKTRAHLEAFAERRKKGGKTALVIAPKTLLASAWGEDAVRFVPDMKVSLAYAENREEAFLEKADLYITNTDATKWLAKQPKRFFSTFDSLIIDESSTFKHRTSQRSKALAKIKNHFKYRTLLTGTPNSNSITDIWHQAFIADDGQRLGSNFFKFRMAVCYPEQIGPKIQHLKWVDKDGAEEAVAGLLADITIRNDFEECMDIPPNHTYPVSFTMPARLQSQYLKLEEHTILELEKGEVVAVNAAVLRNKLLQLCSGAVYTQGGKYEVLDTSRYELVSELVKERKHSIVFFNWAHQKEELIRLLTKEGVTHGVIDGNTPIAKRKALVASYQAGFLQTMLLHPQTGAHGLTLTRGTATIWCSPIYQADFLKQGKHRIWRGGQTQRTETILVQAEGTVEEKVYARLNGKSERMISFLDLMKGE